MAFTDIQTTSIRAVPAATLVGRILLGSLFLLSGIDKAANYAATQGYMAAFGIPVVLLPVVIVFQVSAALALILGWRPHVAALLLAGFSLMTGLVFHTDFGDQIQTIMFLKNVSIAGGLLFFAGTAAQNYAQVPRPQKTLSQ